MKISKGDDEDSDQETQHAKNKRNKGIELKKKYLDKHISYVSVCILLWALFQSISFYKLYQAS
jgi:hypothetical protein